MCHIAYAESHFEPNFAGRPFIYYLDPSVKIFSTINMGIFNRFRPQNKNLTGEIPKWKGDH